MARRIKKIPNRLRKHRRLMGYSLTEVALLLGYKNVSRISKWEKGKSMPNAENLLRLSYLYRTLVNELYLDLSREMQEDLRQRERKVAKKLDNVDNNGPP